MSRYILWKKEFGMMQISGVRRRWGQVLVLGLMVGGLGLCCWEVEGQVIFSNGTGGGDFDVPATWQGSVVPSLASQSFTVLAGDTVDGNDGNIARSAGATVAVDGTLDLNTLFFSAGAGGMNVHVTGNLTNVERLISDGVGLNGAVKLDVDGGIVSFGNRIALTNANASSTRTNELTLSNHATVTGNGTGFFQMWGADADDRAQLTINGPGTFLATSIALFNSGAADPVSTGTEIRFNFGSTAGTGALAAMTSTNYNGLLINSNALTIDFSGIDRSLFYGNLTTTLFDYADFAGQTVGSFGTVTFLGLEPGETAAINHVTSGNRRFDLDYSLIQVPEPATLLMFGVGGLAVMLLRGWFRARVGR